MSVRSLLQVKVADSEDAAQVFSTPMGDVVEPRRGFIVASRVRCDDEKRRQAIQDNLWGDVVTPTASTLPNRDGAGY